MNFYIAFIRLKQLIYLVPMCGVAHLNYTTKMRIISERIFIVLSNASFIPIPIKWRILGRIFPRAKRQVKMKEDEIVNYTKTLKTCGSVDRFKSWFLSHSTETLINRVKMYETFKSSNGKQKLIKLFLSSLLLFNLNVFWLAPRGEAITNSYYDGWGSENERTTDRSYWDDALRCSRHGFEIGIWCQQCGFSRPRFPLKLIFTPKFSSS